MGFMYSNVQAELDPARALNVSTLLFGHSSVSARTYVVPLSDYFGVPINSDSCRT
jgi:hypothetical protein